MKNKIKTFINRQSGQTIMEALTGLSLFMAVLLPALLIFIKLNSQAAYQDRLIALEILKNEFSVIKTTNILPPGERHFVSGGKTFTVRCATAHNAGLVEWHLKIFRNRDSLCTLSGLLPEE